jgi:outer membrane protein
MKNGLLIWNAVLTLLTGYLLITHFTGNSARPVSHFSRNSTDSNSHSNSFRIAYIEMDSIENNCQMVKDVRDSVNMHESRYKNDLAGLDWEYNNRVESYRQRAASMTHDDIEKAKTDLQQLEGQLKEKKNRLDQDYQSFVMRSQVTLKSAIADFLKSYQKSKDYSYIIVYDQNLFYYRDTAYNITDDVIRGLNEEYRKTRKPEPSK